MVNASFAIPVSEFAELKIDTNYDSSNLEQKTKLRHIERHKSCAVASKEILSEVKQDGTLKEDAAWEALKQSIVYFKGKPTGTVAAIEKSKGELNYDQVIMRDFVPSALAFLMKGEPQIVKNFLLKTARFQSRDKMVDLFKLGKGVMPASFKVHHSHPPKKTETLVADFAEIAIGRVAPVDSGLWWIFILSAYAHYTMDDSLADNPVCQKAMRLILKLWLSEGFDTSPALLCADGCSMIDRKMVIMRDFVPSALAFLMKGEPQIVKNFLLETARFQSRDKMVDLFKLGKGVMPASFKVHHSHPPKKTETLVADFGEIAVARVAPVDSGLWWIFILSAYIHYTVDKSLANSRDCQDAMCLILKLWLSEGFNSFPALLCADGCSMIDRNVMPESIPDWIFDFMPSRGGYFIGNVSPARMDFRWFCLGNFIAILSSLGTAEKAEAILDLVEEMDAEQGNGEAEKDADQGSGQAERDEKQDAVVDLAFLPEAIIGAIAARLVPSRRSIESMRAVSRHWRQSLPPTRGPWLVLSPRSIYLPSIFLAIFHGDLVRQRPMFPPPSSDCCWSCSRGFMALDTGYSLCVNCGRQDPMPPLPANRQLTNLCFLPRIMCATCEEDHLIRWATYEDEQWFDFDYGLALAPRSMTQVEGVVFIAAAPSSIIVDTIFEDRLLPLDDFVEEVYYDAGVHHQHPPPIVLDFVLDVDPQLTPWVARGLHIFAVQAEVYLCVLLRHSQDRHIELRLFVVEPNDDPDGDAAVILPADNIGDYAVFIGASQAFAVVAGPSMMANTAYLVIDDGVEREPRVVAINFHTGLQISLEYPEGVGVVDWFMPASWLHPMPDDDEDIEWHCA